MAAGDEGSKGHEHQGSAHIEMRIRLRHTAKIENRVERSGTRLLLHLSASEKCRIIRQILFGKKVVYVKMDDFSPLLLPAIFIHLSRCPPINFNMRAILFIVAMAALISICQSAGTCSASTAKTCAYCQDVNTRCGYCKQGYQCLGSKASNCYCSANSAYACPSAAGPNCLSCSPPCPGISAGCQKNWNPQWGCTKCAPGYIPTSSSVPLPGTKCEFNYVVTCKSNQTGK
jgi:hypothetical protein